MKAKLISRRIKNKMCYGVEWENGFESAMPDEETAKLVLSAHAMYSVLDKISSCHRFTGELKSEAIEVLLQAKGGV